MPEGKKIEIKPAKGRPMLTWVGKRPLSYVTAFPAQHIETFDPSQSPLGKGGSRGVGVETPNSALIPSTASS
jgi:hypothetical protein